MMYSSAPSMVPMRTSSTSVAVSPHTLPETVRTVIVSATVSATARQEAAPPDAPSPAQAVAAIAQIIVIPYRTGTSIGVMRLRQPGRPQGCLPPDR